MSKERLEEMVNSMCDSYYNYLTADNIKKSEVYYKSYTDYREIILRHIEEQAERVQKLEELSDKDDEHIEFL